MVLFAKEMINYTKHHDEHNGCNFLSRNGSNKMSQLAVNAENEEDNLLCFVEASSKGHPLPKKVMA